MDATQPEEPAERRDRASEARANWPRSNWSRADWIAVGLIFGVALGLRLLNLQQIELNDPFFANPSPDPRLYNDWALAIARGDLLGEGVFLQGPLLPYLLALEFRLFGHSFWLPRFIQCFLGVASCLLTWAIARELFDRRVAALAGGAFAVYGMAIFYGGSLLIANVLVLLNLMVIYSALRAAREPKPEAWAELGVWTGLAILARPNMLLYIAFVLAWGAWLCWDARGFWAADRAGRRRVLSIASFAVAVSLCLAPSLLRNVVVAGDGVLVSASAGMNFYNGNNPAANGTHRVPPLFSRTQADDPREQNRVYKAYAEKATGTTMSASEVSDFWFAKGLDYVSEHPGEWLALLARKARLFWNAHELWNNRSYEVSREFSWVLRLPLLGFGVVLPFALVGFALTWRSWRIQAPLYGLVAVYFATGVVFFVLSRYRFPVVPVLLVFAAAAAVSLWDRARARQWRPFALACCAIAGLSYFVWQPIVVGDLSVAYYNVGNKYLAQERFDRAIELYRQSLSINGAYISAHNNLALALERTGLHSSEAVEAWRRVLTLGQRRGLDRYVEKARRHIEALEAGAGLDRNAK